MERMRMNIVFPFTQTGLGLSRSVDFTEHKCFRSWISQCILLKGLIALFRPLTGVRKKGENHEYPTDCSSKKGT